MAELDTKRRSVQLISANKSTIIKMVHNTLESLYELGDSVIVIRGTPAHEGKGCWIEETFASDLDHTIPDAVRHTASWYAMQTVIAGVRMDLAHYAPMGALPWNKSNAANALARKIVWAYMVDKKQPPPHLVLRAHNHRKAESSGFETQVQFLPAWTSATEYVYTTGLQNSLADVGSIVYLLEDGKYEKIEYLFKPTESRQVWAMKI